MEKLLDRAYKTSADIVKCNHVNYSAESNSITGVIRHDDASISQFGLNIMDFKGYIWGGIIRKTLFSDIRFPEGYWYEDIMMRFTLMKIANDLNSLMKICIIIIFTKLIHQRLCGKGRFKDLGFLLFVE